MFLRSARLRRAMSTAVFSLAPATMESIPLCEKYKKGMVIGTTGFSDEEIKRIKAAGDKIPILLSSNMSIGVNLLYNLVAQAAGVFKSGYDIEIIEKHHRYKKDSPSGTAVTTGKIIESPRTDLATTTATISDNADLTLYDNITDGSPIIRLGASASEEVSIQALMAGGQVVLEAVEFRTATITSSPDQGEYRFYVDGSLSATIDDGGIEVPDGHSYSIDTSEVLNETTLGSSVLASSLTSVGVLTALVVADAGTLEVDIINEATAAAGVTLDSVLLKDGLIAASAVPDNHGVTPSTHHTKFTGAEAITAVEAEATLVLAGDVTVAAGKTLKVDTIAEITSASGVTIDSLLIKDGTIPDALITSRKMAPTVIIEHCTSRLTITGTSAQDVVGCTATFTPAVASTAIVTAVCDMDGLTTGGFFAVELDVDDSLESNQMVYETHEGALSRSMASQQWLVALDATEHTLKLSGKRVGGTGNCSVFETHSSIMIILVDDANTTIS